MSVTSHDLMAFAILAAMKAAERPASQGSLSMTLVPGPSAARAAFATVAVGTQARDSLRRERKVAAATMRAVEEIAAGESFASVLLQSPLLCEVDADEIHEDIRALWALYGTPKFGIELPGEGNLWVRP